MIIIHALRGKMICKDSLAMGPARDIKMFFGRLFGVSNCTSVLAYSLFDFNDFGLFLFFNHAFKGFFLFTYRDRDFFIERVKRNGRVLYGEIVFQLTLVVLQRCSHRLSTQRGTSNGTCYRRTSFNGEFTFRKVASREGWAFILGWCGAVRDVRVLLL